MYGVDIPRVDHPWRILETSSKADHPWRLLHHTSFLATLEHANAAAISNTTTSTWIVQWCAFEHYGVVCAKDCAALEVACMATKLIHPWRSSKYVSA
jgi:hypothetical protein